MQETFIESYQIDTEVCKELIKYHKKNKEYKRPGVAYDTDVKNTAVNTDIKESIDVTFFNMSSNKTIKKYFSELSKCVRQYVSKYKLGRYHTYDSNLIQHYPPGGGFKVWHCERYVGYVPGQFIAQRGLVYMTYLNDVTDIIRHSKSVFSDGFLTCDNSQVEPGAAGATEAASPPRRNIRKETVIK